MNWKNIIERALWTFVQGFLGALILNVEMDKSAIIGALAAGLSALKTLVMEIAEARLKALEQSKDDPA